MQQIIPRAVLLTLLCAGVLVPNVQAATPTHPAATPRDGHSSPWGYEQQREKMMRRVNEVQPQEREPLRKIL